ncbi:MAG: TetR/AcrR family transcriptional regulator [Candidatus Dormiibacterota bacterium]
MRPRGGAAAGSPTAREERRQALVRAAYHQIAERGFEGLRTREVAAEVQLNVATLHYYFPTKERLISGVVDYAMGRFQSTLKPHGSPADQLASHLRAVRDLLNDEPQLSVVMGELALRSARDPEIAAIVGRMSGAWEQAVRGLLRRAVRHGHLPADRGSEEVAALIVSVLASMTLPSMGGGARSDRALRQLERWLFDSATADGGTAPVPNADQPID